MPDSLVAFFNRYRDAFNTFDANEIAEHYLLPAAVYDALGPHVFKTKGTLIAKFQEYCDRLQELGYVNGEFTAGYFHRTSAAGAVVDLEWKLETTDAPIVFRSVYLCRRIDDDWRIFVAEAYEPASAT